jgi:hypothetical protein
MTITFTVAQNKFADNITTSAFATAVKAWLDGLSVTTVHGFEIEHLNGFWVIVIIYV